MRMLTLKHPAKDLNHFSLPAYMLTAIRALPPVFGGMLKYAAH